MLIDWFTVAAQALNFVVLVWLMRHFLYRPILDAIDAREKRIADELADADAKKAQAKAEHAEFQHKNEELDEQRAALLSQATEKAESEGQRLLNEAREAADVLSAKRREALRGEAHDLSLAFGRRTRDEVFAVARKALMDLAATSLEERMSEAFTRRLRQMDAEANAQLAAALEAASEPAVVRSAFELPTQQRAAIQSALNEAFSAEVQLRFEVAPDLIGGVEFATNGLKVAWSIDDYLRSLEKSVAELVGEGVEPEQEVEPQAVPASNEEADEHVA